MGARGDRTPLGHDAVPAATAALERVVADGVPYVVKTLRPRDDGHPHWPASTDPDDPMWWRREADAYGSGLLPDGDLRAARCVWIDDRGAEVELWLEDVTGAPATAWPAERYGPAARALGRWQGAYLAGRPLPAERWLARGWLRAYVERRTGMFDVTAPPRWRRVWDEREAFLSWVEGAPQTPSHLDFWSRNLFDDGGATVAIDWAFVGVAAAGEDASNLVLDAAWDGFLPGDAVRELEALVWPEYLAGLRDAGAAPDERALRLAYAASAAVKYAWIEPWMIQNDASPELWAQRRPVLDLVEELADEGARARGVCLARPCTVAAVPAEAVVLMAYGSPERLEDVPAYYADIRGGRPIAPEHLEDLVDRYRRLGIEESNPLNAITEETRAALERELGAPVFTGMKHWTPRIADAADRAVAAGAEVVVGLVLAPHYSRLSIAGYRSLLEDALGDRARLAFIDSWHDEPSFVSFLADRIAGTDAHVVFTAHSLPARILDEGDPYKDELLETARLVAQEAGHDDWSFSFQSESPTGEPWLGPDILDHLEDLHARGVRDVLVCPIGFVSDHLEIRWDIDFEAQEKARELGLRLSRIEMPNADPRFVAGLAGIVRRALALPSAA